MRLSSIAFNRDNRGAHCGIYDLYPTRAQTPLRGPFVRMPSSPTGSCVISLVQVHYGVEISDGASSLRLAQESKPDALEQLDCAIITMQIELYQPPNESDPLSAERREVLERALDRTRKEAAALEALRNDGKPVCNNSPNWILS
jgi:hypothetical protein